MKAYISLLALALSFSCGMQTKVKREKTRNPLAACVPSTEAPVTDLVEGLIKYEVTPTAAASCVTEFVSPHLVFPPALSPKGLLFVFLPGTAGSPEDAIHMLKRGASRGYHAIGLMYPNPISVNSLCNNLAPATLLCAGDVREEILTGSNTSDLVAVDSRNSIEGRLFSLLRYLHSHRPHEGWDEFLNDGEVVWEKIHLAGHSQGSGHAAFLAKRNVVGRVILFSGPSDFNTQLETYPLWMATNPKTPKNRWYGFIHKNDSFANKSGSMSQVTESWGTLLNMLGPVSSVDQGPGRDSYSNGHRLTTNACSTGGEFVKHVCVLAKGYKSVWDYLAFP